MSQAPRYERGKNFAEDYGNETDHAAMNMELDAVAASVNSLRANQAILQNDDGSLRQGIVTVDSVDSALKDALSANIVSQVQSSVSEAQNAASAATTAATIAQNSELAAESAQSAAEQARNAAQLNAAASSSSAASANTAATSAGNSATAAANSAASASASATSASNSATSAASSAATATTAATNAGNSATSAGSSAVTATTAATNATGSAAAAANSATEAAASASSALNSKNAAVAAAASVDAANIVHRTGDEAIGGKKTFEDHSQFSSYGENMGTRDLSANHTIDFHVTKVTNYKFKLLASIALQFQNAPSNQTFGITLRIEQDATGGREITWPASVKWAGNKPPALTDGAGKVDYISLVTWDGGVRWDGFIAGQDY